MDRKFWTNVLQAVVIALLVGLIRGGCSAYDELKELRRDVDALYSEVDDVAKKQ